MCCSVLQCVHSNESCCAYVWVTSCTSMSHVTQWVMSHTNTSCHTHNCTIWWVMAYTWIRLFVAVCCSVLQCVALCYSVLQCVAVCYSVLQCVAVCCSVLQCIAVCGSMLQYVAVCCSVLQCVAVCCSVLHDAMNHEIRMNTSRHITHMNASCQWVMTHTWMRYVKESLNAFKDSLTYCTKCNPWLIKIAVT